MQRAYLELFTHYLRQRWVEINEEVLGGRLCPPALAITQGSRVLGAWDRESRTLSLSAALLLHQSELEIEETLKHEMAHQFADEILEAHTLSAETPHGGAFRYACEQLGISHSARLAAKGETSPLLAKIRKLLALAESPNIHEAEAAMTRARALMARYELDLGVRDLDFCYRYIGGPKKQRSAVVNMIGVLIMRHFGVTVIWMPSRMIHPERGVWLMEICGTLTNVEIAEYVHAYLVHELEILWHEKRRRKPQYKGRSLKRDFQLGVMRGLAEKLKAEETKKLTSAGHQLVLLKRHQLECFFAKRHPDVARGRAIRYRATEAWHAGFSEGQNLDLRRGIDGSKVGPTPKLGTGLD